MSRPALVAAAAAVIGFGAVYVTLSPSANAPVNLQPSETVSTATPAPQKPTTDAAVRTASSETDQTRAGEPAAPIDLTMALPTGPGRNPLSVGEMAMFVFKRPQELPEVNFFGPTGEPTDLTAWKGKVILVNLWATWCGPCREEMPDLDSLQAQLGGDDFEVVAISLDRGTAVNPKRFLDEIGVKNLKLYHEPTARLGSKLQAIGMPATLLIDRQGREIGRLVGPAHWGSPDAVRLVKTVIEKTRTPG